MKCNLQTCRYNKFKECTNDDGGKLCYDVAYSVLGINSDGCEFCNADRSMRVEQKSHDDYIDCGITHDNARDKNVMKFETKGRMVALDIFYCPVCGRKLAREEVQYK